MELRDVDFPAVYVHKIHTVLAAIRTNTLFGLAGSGFSTAVRQALAALSDVVRYKPDFNPLLFAGYYL